MRGLRSTLVLLMVAVGLGAYIYFVERHRAPAGEEDPNEQLFSFVAGDVTELQRNSRRWRHRAASGRRRVAGGGPDSGGG